MLRNTRKQMLALLAVATVTMTTSSYGATWTKIEDFEGLAPGDLVGQNGWTSDPGNSDLAQVVASPTNGAEQSGTVRNTASVTGVTGAAHLSLGPAAIAPDTVGTFFFRVFLPTNGNNQTYNLMFGISDDDTPEGRRDFAVAIFGADGGNGNNSPKMNDGGGTTNVPESVGAWRNYWLVHNVNAGTSDDRKYELWSSQGSDPAAFIQADVHDSARNGTTSLDTIAISKNFSDLTNVTDFAYIDDIYIDNTGANLTNPLAPPPAGDVDGTKGTSSDAYVQMAVPGGNFGNEATMVLQKDIGSNEQRPYIKFDDLFGAGAGKIPEGLDPNDLLSATLLLYSDGGTGGVKIFEAADDWDEDTLTWSNQPGLGDLLEEFSLSSGLNEIDVTSTIKSLLASGTPNALNYGWVLTDSGAGRPDIELVTSEGQSQRQPELRFIIATQQAAVPEPASLVLVGLAGLPLMVRRRRDAK